MSRLSRLAGGSAVTALLSIAAMSGAAHAQTGPVASPDACNILFSRTAAGAKPAQIAALDRFLGACPSDSRVAGARARRARLANPPIPTPAPRPRPTPAPHPHYAPTPTPAPRYATPTPSPSPVDTSIYGDLDSQQVVDLFRNNMLCAGFRESDYSCSSITWATTLDSTVINYVEKAGWYIEPDIRANYRSGYDLSFDPEWEGISNFMSYSVSSRGVCDSTAERYWTETTAVFSDGTNSLELQGDALAAYRTRMGENREPVTDHPCVRFERHAGTRYDTVWKTSDDGSTVSYTVLPRDGHFVKYRLWNRDPITLRD